MYVMKNKRECQQGVSSRLRGQQRWNHGMQTLCGPEEPTTDWCWRSVENVIAKKRAEVSWLTGVESVHSTTVIMTKTTAAATSLVMSHCAPEATLKAKCFEFTPKTVIWNVFIVQVYWEAVPNTWPGSYYYSKLCQLLCYNKYSTSVCAKGWVSTEQSFMETSLSRQSLTLVLKTQNKQEKIHQRNTKQTTNWPQVRKTQKSLTKTKSVVPSTFIRTAHMCVLMTVYSYGRQYSTEQFWQSSLLSSICFGGSVFQTYSR